MEDKMKTIANCVAAIAALFANPTPALPSYQERQAAAHQAYNTWYAENEAKHEALRLESWFAETNRIANTQKNIDAHNKSARSIHTWVNGAWKCVGYKTESCIISK